METGFYENKADVLDKAFHLLEENRNKHKNLVEVLDEGYNSYLAGKHRKVSAKQILDNVLAKKQR